MVEVCGAEQHVCHLATKYGGSFGGQWAAATTATATATTNSNNNNHATTINHNERQG